MAGNVALARAISKLATSAPRASRATWAPLSILFPAQISAFNDNSQFRAALCSRRAGKSHLAIVELVTAALSRSDSLCVYIGLTLAAAKKDIWRDLINYVNRNGLTCKIDLTNTLIEFENGSVIRLRGLADRSEIEWFRGTKYDLVIVDEMQSQGAYVRELLDDIIGPALLDRGGRVLLLGTPGWVEAGFWWEVVGARSQDYAVHTWTLRDNPNLPNVDAFLAKMAKRLGGENSPKFQREYLGLWARDTAGLVFKFDRAINYYDELPGPLSEAESVIGIDTGSVDADAINVWSWWPKLGPDLYQTAEIVKSKQSTDTLIAQAMSMIQTFRPHRAVIDPAYGGKKVADTILERYGIVVEMAEKDRKLEFCEFFDTDLRTGRIKCMRSRVDERGDRIGGRLADDLAIIAWDKKALEIGERKIAKHPHSDIGDAALYAHRAAKHFWFKAPPPVRTAEQRQNEELRAYMREREAMMGGSALDRDSLYR